MDTLTIDVEKIPNLFIPQTTKITIRQEFGIVILFLGNKRAELTTIIAHGIGMAIAKAQLDQNEMIVLSINKERIELLWPVAKKVSTTLLRKADDADDWQLTHRRKLA